MKNSSGEDKCIECEENNFRVLNNFSGYCECKNGYKEIENTKECKKCFHYNGECVLECPMNTSANDKEFICEPKNYKIVDNVFLILICSIVFVLVSTLLLVCVRFCYKPKY